MIRTLVFYWKPRLFSRNCRFLLECPRWSVKRDPTLAQNPHGLDHLSFSVEDVNKLYAELKTKGLPSWASPRIKTGAHGW